MVWDKKAWNTELLKLYRRLIPLRRLSPILQRGGIGMLAIEDGGFAYQRKGIHNRIFVIVWRGAHSRPARPLAEAHAGIPDGSHIQEYFYGETCSVRDGSLMIPEQGQGASLWVEDYN